MGFIYCIKKHFLGNQPKTYFLTSWLRQQSAKDPNPAAEKNVDTSRFWTGKPNSCSNHIYHFHVLEFPHLNFFKTFNPIRSSIDINNISTETVFFYIKKKFLTIETCFFIPSAGAREIK